MFSTLIIKYGGKMNKLTKLEKTVMQVLNIKTESDFKKITQYQLDRHAEEIISLLSAQDLIDHTRYVYDKTTKHFDNDPHITEGVIDELIEFMKKLNDNDFVYDLGCGNGRDTLFMATKSIELRKKMMQRISQGKKTIDKFSVPKKTLWILAMDISREMLKTACKTIDNYSKTFNFRPAFLRGDMHALKLYTGLFHGIWSCTSFLVHTPEELIEPSLKIFARLLKPKGKFGLCYIQEQPAGKYNRLILSSTGYIKYFSQPNPKIIQKIAKKCSLNEIFFRITDYEIKGKLIQKDFFANHIFEKGK